MGFHETLQRNNGMTTRMETNVDSFNSLLRGELSAVETYDQALGRLANEPQEPTIRRIREEHVKASTALRDHVVEHGGDPAKSSGPWGYFATAVTGTAKLLGVQATLSALSKGEEHGIKTYEEAVKKEDLPHECQLLISDRLLPQTRRHMKTLDDLIASVK